jgi:putative transcriptional regulator
MSSSRDRDVSQKGDVPASGGNRIMAMTAQEARANALADEDNPPLPDDRLARLRPVPKLLEISKRSGLTQREFAKQLQIALGNLRNWEQWHADPIVRQRPTYA